MRRKCDRFKEPLIPCAFPRRVPDRRHGSPIRDLAEQVPKEYIFLIELRPNDLASPRLARRTDDLLPKLEQSGAGPQARLHMHNI